MDPFGIDPNAIRQAQRDVAQEQAAMLADQQTQALLERASRLEAYYGINQPEGGDPEIRKAANQTTDYFNNLFKQQQQKRDWLLQNGYDDALESLAVRITSGGLSRGYIPREVAAQLPPELHDELLHRVQQLAAARDVAQPQNFAQRVGRGFKEGVGQLAQLGDYVFPSFQGEGLLENQQPRAFATPLSPEEELFRARVTQAAQAGSQTNPYKWYDPRGAAIGAAQNLPTMAPTMAAAAINPAAGALMAGATMLPQERAQMLAARMSPEEATAAALASSAAGGVIEMAAPFGGYVPGGTVGRIAREALTEAGEEAAQSLTSDLIQSAQQQQLSASPAAMLAKAGQSGLQALGPAALVGTGGKLLESLGGQTPPQEPPNAQQVRQAAQLHGNEQQPKGPQGPGPQRQEAGPGQGRQGLPQRGQAPVVEQPPEPTAPPYTPPQNAQPWQLTREQFFYQAGTSDGHRAAVEQALAEGKLVPDAVLKVYPDLVQKYVTSTVPPAAKTPVEQAAAPKPPGAMLQDAIASGKGAEFVQTYPELAKNIATLPETPAREPWKKVVGLTLRDAKKWTADDRAQARKRVVDALAQIPSPEQTQTGGPAQATVTTPPVEAPRVEQPDEGQKEGQGQAQAELLAPPSVPQSQSPAPNMTVGAGPLPQPSLKDNERGAKELADMTATERAAEQAQAAIEKERAQNVPLGSGAVLPGKIGRGPEPPAVAQLKARWNTDAVDVNGIPLPNRRALSDTQNAELNEASKVRPPTFLKRLKEHAIDFVRRATRSVRELPRSGKWAGLREYARAERSTREVSTNEAYRAVRLAIGNLTEYEYPLFNDYFLVNNLLESYRHSEPGRFNIPNDPTGINTLRQWKKDTDEAIDAYARPDGTNAIKEAIARREAVREETVDDLIQYEFLPESVVSGPEARRSYYHQSVLKYAAEGVGFTGKKKGSKPGFTKARVVDKDGKLILWPSALNYNTDFIEAEMEWLRDAGVAIRKKQNFDKHVRPLDISAKVKDEADAANDADNWKKYIPEGYELYELDARNPWFKATTLLDSVVAKIMGDQAKQIPGAPQVVTEDDLREVLAVGRKRDPLVLPREAVQMLRRFETEQPKTGLLVDLTSFWKNIAVNWPTRFIKRITRDQGGNFEKVTATDPGIFNKMPRALREAYRYVIGNLTYTPRFQEFMDRFGVSGTFQTTEASGLRKDRHLGPLLRGGNLPKIADILSSTVSLPLDVAAAINETIELGFRYATYLHLVEKAEAGKPFHFGASRAADVEYVLKHFGPKDAAAMVARQLFGDYKQVTELADALSKVAVPFAKFMQSNLVAWPRIVANDLVYAKALAESGTKNMRGTIARAGGKAITAATIATRATLWATTRLVAMHAIAMAWNKLVMGEADDELTEAQKAQPYLIYGYKYKTDPKTGKVLMDPNDPKRKQIETVYYLRGFGALSDFLANFGYGAAVQNFNALLDKQISGTKYALEVAKAIGNRGAQAVGPWYKLLGETVIGRDTYPDAFSPTAKPRDELIAKNLAVKDEYMQLKGWLEKDGTIVDPKRLERMVANVSEIAQANWSEAHQLRERFLVSIGEKVEDRGEYGAGRLGIMRRLAWADRKDAFPDARTSFLKDAGYEKDPQKAYGSFLDSIDKLDPIGRGNLTPAKEREFMRWITPEQRRRMRIARDSAADSYYKLFQWMDEASTDDPAWVKARDRWLGGKVQAATRPIPNVENYEGKFQGARRFAEAKEEWQGSRDRARRDLQTLDLPFRSLMRAGASRLERPMTPQQDRKFSENVEELELMLRALPASPK